MNATNAAELSFWDALNQVISDPVSRFHWQNLLNRILSSNDSGLHQLAYERIDKEIANEGIAGFHRAVFLAHVFSVDGVIEEAAGILCDLRPVHIDRIMAFINTEWATRLVRGKSAKDLVHHFSSIKIKVLLQLVAQQIELIPLASSERSKKINRIAIYSPQINDLNHPPTILTLQHAKLLQTMGLEVKIFSAQELQIEHGREYLSSDAQIHNAVFDQAMLETMKFTKSIEVLRTNVDFSLALRYQHIANQINQYQPDVLFFIGNHSPLLDALYRHMPILALNVNSHAPVGEYDIWLSAKKAPEILLSSDRARSFYYPFRVFRKTSPPNFSVLSPGRRSEKLTLITVGARLPDEITPDWVENIKPLFDEFPYLKWKLVGGTGLLPPALKLFDASQLEVLPHTEDIVEHLEAADIYINPPRVGGGFSVAEAMSVGVPCLAYCGTDGGAKLLDYAVIDSNEFSKELRNLIKSTELRQKWSIAMVDIFEKTINLENAGESWMNAANQALSRYADRV